MIDLKLNTEGMLTEEAKAELQVAMSELAHKCLVALTTLTPEDLRVYSNNAIETDNVKNVKNLLEEIVVESDIPVILTSNIGAELKLINALLGNIGHAFVNAQTMIALDAMGKKKETEVSVKDVREAYNKIVAKNVAEAVAE
jgi:hypothetical protein